MDNGSATPTVGIMQTRFSNLVQYLSMLKLLLWAAAPLAIAQAPASFDLQPDKGLTLRRGRQGLSDGVGRRPGTHKQPERLALSGVSATPCQSVFLG